MFRNPHIFFTFLFDKRPAVSQAPAALGQCGPELHDLVYECRIDQRTQQPYDTTSEHFRTTFLVSDRGRAAQKAFSRGPSSTCVAYFAGRRAQQLSKPNNFGQQSCLLQHAQEPKCSCYVAQDAAALGHNMLSKQCQITVQAASNQAENRPISPKRHLNSLRFKAFLVAQAPPSCPYIILEGKTPKPRT